MGYVVSYCIAHFKKEEKDKAIVDYFSAGLQYISENVAYCGNAYGSDGHYLSLPLDDILNPKEVEEVDVDEYIDNIFDKCGL